MPPTHVPPGQPRVAVVTGGAQGLGLGSVEQLLLHGYRVAIVDVQPTLPPEAADRISGKGTWTYFSADVADPDASTRISADIASRWGGIDGLVNNAGIFPRSPSIELSLREWDRVLRINLTGTFLFCQAIGRLMLGQGRGAIVNTASGRAIQGAASGVAYASSKAGVIALTRSLATEWAPHVRVNCVVPGLSDTAQPRAVLSESDLDAAARTIPLGRIGTPADIGRAVAFLLGDDSSFITGQCLAVNGGAIMM